MDSFLNKGGEVEIVFNAGLNFFFLSVKPECVHDGPVTLGVVPKRDAEVSILKFSLRMS